MIPRTFSVFVRRITLLAWLALLVGCQQAPASPPAAANPAATNPAGFPPAGSTPAASPRVPIPTYPPDHAPIAAEPGDPAPIDVVKIAWFYKPPEDRALLPSLVNRYDTFVLTRGDEAERDTLRGAGLKQLVLRYLRADAIMDPGSCVDAPWRNQAADQPGDFCRIQAEHPDWFLGSGAGRAVRLENDVHMDPAQPGWRAFFLAQASQQLGKNEWEGVFLDNVDGSPERYRREGIRLVKYPDEASFQAAVEGFLSYLYLNHFGVYRHPIYANITYLHDPAVFFRYLRYLDGAMIENFAVDWEDGYLDPGLWEVQMQLAEKAQGMGKQVILVSQGAQDDQARQLYAFASYLLVSNGRAAFRYSNDDFYRSDWYYPNYSLDLGQPLGGRYQDGQVWRRDFTRATVLVDPVEHTAQIITP